MQPPIHEVSSLSALNTSMQTMYDTLIKGAKNTEALAAPAGSWIDVRDVARAHALAAQVAAPGGRGRALLLDHAQVALQARALAGPLPRERPLERAEEPATTVSSFLALAFVRRIPREVPFSSLFGFRAHALSFLLESHTYTRLGQIGLYPGQAGSPGQFGSQQQHLIH